MTQTAVEAIGQLRAVMEGPVIGPGDPGFDDGRRVWNGGIDRRPAVIARCASAADVAAAIGFAREHGLEIAVRGGAHNMAGSAVCDGGLMIDLSRMNRVTVDPDARRATVGGGATVADVDAATQAHGLAAPGGLVSHTGVGGLTLGGGMGWLTRKGGLSIDNLLSAEVVTADGRVLRRRPDENPDLFWAHPRRRRQLRRRHRLRVPAARGRADVQFGLFFWPLDQGAGSAAADPRDLRGDAARDGHPGRRAERAARAVRPAGASLRARLRAAADRVRLRPSTPGWPPGSARACRRCSTWSPRCPTSSCRSCWTRRSLGRHAYEKGTYVEDLTDR